MCVRLPPTFQIWIRKVISCTRLTWLRSKGGEGERGVCLRWLWKPASIVLLVWQPNCMESNHYSQVQLSLVYDAGRSGRLLWLVHSACQFSSITCSRFTQLPSFVTNWVKNQQHLLQINCQKREKKDSYYGKSCLGRKKKSFQRNRKI